MVRKLEMVTEETFEIAYTLARSAWGRGYAREGAAAALRYARETLRQSKIASIIRPENRASIRIAQSLGAVAGETVEFFGAPSVVYWYPSTLVPLSQDS